MMDQNTAIADALLKTPSLIGGLLSQMNGNLANGFSRSGMFSSLLSQNANLQASLTSLARMPSVMQNGGGSSSTSSSSSSSLSSASSSSDLLQNLSSLSTTLRQVLRTLRQQRDSDSPSSSASKTSPSTTASATADAQNGDAGQTSTAAAQNNSAASDQSDNSAPDAQSNASAAATPSDSAAASTGDATATTTTDGSDVKLLTDIVAELLMLTQMMMKNLQQPQKVATADATTGVKASGIGALESATLANATGTGAASGADALTGPAGAADATSDGSGTDPLLQLLTVLQQTAQQFMPKTTADTKTTASSPTIAAHLAALDTGLKNVFAALQKKQSETTEDVLTQVNDNSISGFTSLAQSASDSSVKSTKGDDWKTQLFGILGGSSQTGAQQMTQPTPQQAFAAALATSADKASSMSSTNSDGGSDLLSGNNNASASSATSNSAGMTAEGSAAVGTYTFASQLSAFRTANGGTAGLPTAVDQVILQMNRSVKSGQDQMSLQLQPGDLGKITVKLDFGADGKVQGMVTAENPQTLDMLQKDSRSLERALQDAGLRADPGSLQFSLGGQSNQNLAGQNARNGNAGTGGNGTTLANENGEDGLIDLGAIAETYYVTPGGVNIRV